jgi:hypothetical protein
MVYRVEVYKGHSRNHGMYLSRHFIKQLVFVTNIASFSFQVKFLTLTIVMSQTLQEKI